uniref:Splicing factor U2AF 65 kDa subunit n=1 Tax=Cajanus cajan TaxID=3821 RepID=A0A151SRT7_CAJCA|nr:Splicing factor U2AF 65 kDa subunit [Cajanus cajan]
MRKSNHSKQKHGKSNRLSEDNCDEESAARTRPFSFEEIMLRRRNRELLENVKDPARGCSSEKISDHFEPARIYKHDKSASFGMEKHATEELVKVSSRKKVESTYVKVDDLTEGKKANRTKSERKIKRKSHIGEDENPNEYVTEKRHDRDRDNRWKMKKWLSNDSEEAPEKKHYRESDRDSRHAEGRAKYERETKRKYRNGDDETQDRNIPIKHDAMKHHNMHKERREKVNSRKKHPDIDRNRVSTNGSSSHHHRHSSSTSGLGGYSPRKRKSEAAVKTPSPSKHSLEKKRAGWDLPPAGTNNLSPAVVSSSFLLSTCAVFSNTHDVVSTNSLDLALVKPLPVSFLSDVSTGKNTNIDSVQLTQATRPMRRLYLENIPASASEKAVMDCFNNLLLSARVNHIQQAQPCISCILHKDRGQALIEFLTAEDASSALSFDGSTLFGSIVKIRRPKDYVEVATGEPERAVDDTAVTISDVVIDSPHKIFIGGISNHLSSEMLMEIAGAFGSLKAYHFETKVNGSCAFLEYVDHSVTIKACAGLNGMKLGGEVLTVVQAMPDASPSENGGEPPTYGIPDHAKSLLRKPTQVLEIKNVFAADSILSLSDMGIEEILDDVRLECARFGTVKSINVVKHNSDKNLATKLKECEVIDQVDSEVSQDRNCITNNTESSFSDKATFPKSEGTNGQEFHDDKELEGDKIDGGSSAKFDENAEVFDNKSCREHIVSETEVEDVGGRSIPCSIIQECPDQQDTPDDGPEFHDKMVANDIDEDVENKMVGDNMESKDTISAFQDGFSERDASSELVCPQKDMDVENDLYGHVFELGSIFVEYGRAEACCSAAHCLHGRCFDGRMVTVEYVDLSLYKARFTK